MIHVNGEELGWREKMTVQDVLNAKNYTFKMLSVWVNDAVVMKDSYSSTRVPDGANVQVIHMISGG